MRAAANKIKVFVARMLVVRSEIAHLEDAVADAAEYGAFGDVKRCFPGFIRGE